MVSTNDTNRPRKNVPAAPAPATDPRAEHDTRSALERAATPSPARAQGGPVVQEMPDKPDRISEGVRAELEMYGEALDPNSGRRIVGTGVADARYEDAKHARQASDVAGQVGATRATNELTK